MESDKKLSHFLRARFPYIYVPTYEEDRVTKYIKSIATDASAVKFPREVFTWTQTNGLYNDNTQKGVADTACPCKALEYIRKYEIQFDETQSMGEDFQFVLDYLLNTGISSFHILNTHPQVRKHYH